MKPVVLVKGIKYSKFVDHFKEFSPKFWHYLRENLVAKSVDSIPNIHRFLPGVGGGRGAGSPCELCVLYGHQPTWLSGQIMWVYGVALVLVCPSV